MAQDLGEAKGTIIIDVAQAEAAGIKVKRVGKKMEMDLGRVSIAAKKASVSLGGLGKTLGAVGGIFGLQMGLGFVRQMGMAAVGAADLATAYKRQEVAAISLAGSQAKLNVLLASYRDVTKGSVDDAQALSDVTKLMAVGFADSAAELTAFLNVARGISIAMGKDTDYVIGQLQLAIANQSFMRLDQIGLGVAEVKNRIKELKTESRGLSTEMAFQAAILGIADEKFGALNDATESQITGLERLRKAWKDLRLEMGQDLEGPLGGAAGGLAGLVEGFSEFRKSDLPGRMQEAQGLTRTTGMIDFGAGDESTAVGEKLIEMANAGLALFNQWATSERERVNRNARQRSGGFQYATPQFAGALSLLTGAPGVPASVSTGTGVSAGAGGLDPEQLTKQRAIVSAHYRAVEDIERNASANRIAQVTNFERQRANTIRQFGQTMARESEDFAISRGRANADFARNVSRMERDAVRREADMRAEMERGIGDLRESHQERISEITEDYHRDMERSEADHKEKLLGAAARLDAAGVVAEQRRFAKEKKQKKTNFDKAIRDEKSTLEESIEQRQEALDHQLEIAKRNDERRLEDMKADFERRKQEEDADRERRLERMQADHQFALEEAQRQHDEKMAQIAQQEIDAKIAQEEKFKDQMIEAGLAHETWIEEQKKWQDKALETFQEWWDDINEVMLNRGSTSGDQPDPIKGGDDPQQMRQFADGGPVNRTGPALVHAGEFVLNPRTAGALRGMMGNLDQRSLVNSVGGKNITVAENAINIQASEGMDVEALGQVVRDQLVAALQVAA